MSVEDLWGKIVHDYDSLKKRRTFLRKEENALLDNLQILLSDLPIELLSFLSEEEGNEDESYDSLDAITEHLVVFQKNLCLLSLKLNQKRKEWGISREEKKKKRKKKKKQQPKKQMFSETGVKENENEKKSHSFDIIGNISKDEIDLKKPFHLLPISKMKNENEKEIVKRFRIVNHENNTILKTWKELNPQPQSQIQIQEQIVRALKEPPWKESESLMRNAMMFSSTSNFNSNFSSFENSRIPTEFSLLPCVDFLDFFIDQSQKNTNSFGKEEKKSVEPWLLVMGINVPFGTNDWTEIILVPSQKIERDLYFRTIFLPMIKVNKIPSVSKSSGQSRSHTYLGLQGIPIVRHSDQVSIRTKILDLYQPILDMNHPYPRFNLFLDVYSSNFLPIFRQFQTTYSLSLSSSSSSSSSSSNSNSNSNFESLAYPRGSSVMDLFSLFFGRLYNLITKKDAFLEHAMSIIIPVHPESSRLSSRHFNERADENDEWISKCAIIYRYLFAFPPFLNFFVRVQFLVLQSETNNSESQTIDLGSKKEKEKEKEKEETKPKEKKREKKLKRTNKENNNRNRESGEVFTDAWHRADLIVNDPEKEKFHLTKTRKISTGSEFVDELRNFCFDCLSSRKIKQVYREIEGLRTNQLLESHSNILRFANSVEEVITTLEGFSKSLPSAEISEFFHEIASIGQKDLFCDFILRLPDFLYNYMISLDDGDSLLKVNRGLHIDRFIRLVTPSQDPAVENPFLVNVLKYAMENPFSNEFLLLMKQKWNEGLLLFVAQRRRHLVAMRSLVVALQKEKKNRLRQNLPTVAHGAVKITNPPVHSPFFPRPSAAVGGGIPDLTGLDTSPTVASPSPSRSPSPSPSPSPFPSPSPSTFQSQPQPQSQSLPTSILGSSNDFRHSIVGLLRNWTSFYNSNTALIPDLKNAQRGDIFYSCLKESVGVDPNNTKVKIYYEDVWIVLFYIWRNSFSVVGKQNPEIIRLQEWFSVEMMFITSIVLPSFQNLVGYYQSFVTFPK